jgi:hypothetical protein
VNEAATKTYGYTRDEFLSMTVDSIRAKEDIPALLIKNATGANELVLSSPWRHETRVRESHLRRNVVAPGSIRWEK